MTDDELRQLVASIAIAQKELTEQQKRTDIQLAKTDAQLAKTDAHLAKVSRKLDRLGELVGNISNNQGDIAEEFFYQSLLKKPELGSLKFDSISRNLNNHIGNIQEEYDLVLMNGNSLAVIEVKAKAHPKDLEAFVQRKMVNFPKLFKGYKNYQRYAGFATLVSNEALVAKAQELGLFLLTQRGKHRILAQEGRLIN